MVEKVIIDFNDVRGLGNIISPPHNSTDYACTNSVITTSSDIVNGATTTVYKLVYTGSTFLLTVTSSIVASGSTVTVSVQLTDDNGDPIENASVALYKVT